MSTIAVVGGHGKIAMKLHPLLVEAGYTSIALARSEAYREEIASAGAGLRVLDIERAGLADFERALEGVDAIVFTAGGGPDGNIERKRTVDLEGSLNAQLAAANLGISRFIQVSAHGVDNPVAPDSTAVWEAYVDAKAHADRSLRESELAWTILRPGRLTDEEPSGAILLGETVDPGAITRADVAALILEVLHDDRTIGRQWEAINGSLPIAQAVTQAVS
ncbi:SDR family oxidoreductase [Timonella senegalensis]|uniref:SDR family oxidoreductase n=1 Tax=Timonella senegalensis TaxID=1465825 RepID=UPI000594E946|nr:SDR family oxidoreductase [Timonella senegalensis]